MIIARKMEKRQLNKLLEASLVTFARTSKFHLVHSFTRVNGLYVLTLDARGGQKYLMKNAVEVIDLNPFRHAARSLLPVDRHLRCMTSPALCK